MRAARTDLTSGLRKKGLPPISCSRHARRGVGGPGCARLHLQPGHSECCAGLRRMDSPAPSRPDKPLELVLCLPGQALAPSGPAPLLVCRAGTRGGPTGYVAPARMQTASWSAGLAGLAGGGGLGDTPNAGPREALLHAEGRDGTWTAPPQTSPVTRWPPSQPCAARTNWDPPRWYSARAVAQCTVAMRVRGKARGLRGVCSEPAPRSQRGAEHYGGSHCPGPPRATPDHGSPR